VQALFSRVLPVLGIGRGEKLKAGVVVLQDQAVRWKRCDGRCA
jgi:hypothetical protein